MQFLNWDKIVSLKDTHYITSIYLWKIHGKTKAGTKERTDARAEIDGADARAEADVRVEARA